MYILTTDPKTLHIGSRIRGKNKFVIYGAFSFVNLLQIDKLNMTSISKYNTKNKITLRKIVGMI